MPAVYPPLWNLHVRVAKSRVSRLQARTRLAPASAIAALNGGLAKPYTRPAARQVTGTEGLWSDQIDRAAGPVRPVAGDRGGRAEIAECGEQKQRRTEAVGDVDFAQCRLHRE